jgi:hypothetical protein
MIERIYEFIFPIKDLIFNQKEVFKVMSYKLLLFSFLNCL